MGFAVVRLPKRAVVVAVSGGAEGFVAEARLRRVEARSWAACWGDVREGSVSMVSKVWTAGANSLGRFVSSSSSSSEESSSSSSWRAASWFNSRRRVFRRFMRLRLSARSFWTEVFCVWVLMSWVVCSRRRRRVRAYSTFCSCQSLSISNREWVGRNRGRRTALTRLRSYGVARMCESSDVGDSSVSDSRTRS